MADLLFELGTEELPSGAVQPLAKALRDNIVTGLSKAALSHAKVHYFATPRRLAVLVHDLQTVQASQHVTRRGPACLPTDGEQPSQALQGFAKSCGVPISELTTTKTDKGEWWIYESTQAGANTSDLLPAIITAAVTTLPIAKPMRWCSEVEFARPVHWALLLFGEALIPAQILGVKTSRTTRGHRFMAPESFEVTAPKDYEAMLQNAFVMADFEKRRDMIAQQVEHLAQQQNCQAVVPTALLDEVTSIVEWPHALLARFDREFLEVPAEALIAAMQLHQKCFALRDAHGALSPSFITVANIESSKPLQVVLGNEKVMHARLSDAAFFYRQDKKLPLSQHIAATHQVVFQIKLGSLADKAQRIMALMHCFVTPLQLDIIEAERAALLSKCDLLTGMVGEFPELQGLMGYYYARNDHEPEAVACALAEQYMPRFAADELPSSNLGLALSLADRLDTLVGIFAIGQKPTGVKDPFKLRRHALAIVRMLVGIPGLNLSTLMRETHRIYGDCLPVAEDNAFKALQTFILERMQSFYHGQGISADLLHAVRARQDDCLFDVDLRIKALRDFICLPEALALSAACKRVNNLLQQTSVQWAHQDIDVALFTEPAEHALFIQIQAIEQEVSADYVSGDYARILNQLASLREPVDAFFEHVMVMVDDHAVLQNRLSLLARLQTLLQGVADISLLQSV